MLRKILVPLDGSPFAERALPIAQWIAARSGAAVTLIEVHMPVALMPFAGSTPVDAAGELRLRVREQEYLEEVAERLAGEPGPQVTTELVDGPVVDAIDDYARRSASDLIVMTTHGRGGFSRAWLGSVADGLVRQSNCPLLLVRPDEIRPETWADPGFRRILVALDGSDLAARVLPMAVELARLDNAELVLLRVVSPMIFTDTASTGLGVFMNRSDVEVREAAAADYLEEIARRLRREELATRPAVARHPQPAAAILDEAGVEEVDLIALSTHGHGGLKRLLIGSVADKVLRGAVVPVLITRPAGP